MIVAAEKDHQRALLISDNMALIGIVLLLPLVPALRSSGSSFRSFWSALCFAGTLAIVWTLTLKTAGAYTLPLRPRREIVSIAKASGVLALVIVGISGLPAGSATVVLIGIAASALLLRHMVPKLILALAGHSSHTRILVIGEPTSADAVQQVFENRNGYELVRLELDANAGSLCSYLDQHRPHEVLVAVDGGSVDEWRPVMEMCDERGVPLQFAAPLARQCAVPGVMYSLGNLAVVSPTGFAISGLNLRLKQCFDLLLGSILFVIAVPLLVSIWVCIRFDSAGPAIITQTRIGYKGRPFKFYKFRTMYADADDASHRTYVKQWMQNCPFEDTKTFKIVNDRRITRVGQYLRRYSLDELPQLLNVLKLEMSLVGPRPALPYEVEGYSQWHKERFECYPGLTGIWQVRGRNHVCFDEMARLDLEYLRNWSLRLDLQLLAETIPAVLVGNGH